jgi:hypothetical protein
MYLGISQPPVNLCFLEITFSINLLLFLKRFRVLLVDTLAEEILP